jgi:hypothetical protein
MNEHVKEASAAAATIGSWSLWGWSLTQVNELLTAISLIAATVASIAAFIYYRKRSK